jgi:hypothetical protein
MPFRAKVLSRCPILAIALPLLACDQETTKLLGADASSAADASIAADASSDADGTASTPPDGNVVDPTPCDGSDAGCQPCAALDPQACLNAAPRCIVDACHECRHFIVFKGCRSPNEAPHMCPELDADCLMECEGADELSCEIAPDCHPVYMDEPCGCKQSGCCMTFSRCAQGKTAECTKPIIDCRAAEPVCEGSFVESYINNCYEGCVRPAECA